MNAFRFFSIFSVFVFVSCLETADPNVTTCINTNQIAGIGVISTTRVKKLTVYADAETLCSNDYELLYVKKKNEQFYHLSNIDSITNFKQDDWFVSMGCYIKYHDDMNNKKNVLYILKGEEEIELNIDGLLEGEADLTIISERDTAWLFSYRTSLMVNGNPYYNFSVSSRMGCRDGYCFVSLPITEKELCFDK